MKILLIIAFIVFGYGLAFAQFDPDCYYPKIGEEIDTIYGSKNNQELGRGFDTVSRFLGDDYARVGTIGSIPGYDKGFKTFKTGPDFDIRNFQDVETLGGLDAMNYTDRSVRYGHFRSQKYLDMIVSKLSGYSPDTIYWADDSGRYDRERYTSFVSPLTVDSGYSWDITGVRPSYVTYMTTDTVEDIVMCGVLFHADDSKSKYYLLLYKGGSALYEQGHHALPDSFLELGHLDDVASGIEAGDFRGTGQKDAIIYRRNKKGFNDIMFYKNDPPFSLSKFYNAMRYDTLMTAWENKVFREYNPSPAAIPIMSAYRRVLSDETKDFFLSAQTTDDRHLSLWLFKGGPDFGSKRLYLDSPSYFFWHPSHYDGNNFMSVMPFFSISHNMGDMTGTGNNVLCARGILPVGGQTCLWGFYVLGDAMDDKIDMFFSTQYVGWPIPITADSDNMTDALLGMPFIVSDKDKAKGWEDVGSIGLLHGSKKIPVRKKAIHHKFTLQTGTLSVFPNPASTATTISFLWDKNEDGSLSLWDILGNKVLEQKVALSEGAQSKECQLNVPSGTYLIKVTGGSRSLFTQLIIVR